MASARWPAPLPKTRTILTAPNQTTPQASKMLITDGQVPIMPRSLLAVTNNDATLQDREMGALEGHSGAAIAVDGLTPVAALEQILAVAAGGVNEQALAEGLLSKFGTLSNVLAAADQELLGFNGMTAEALK